MDPVGLLCCSALACLGYQCESHAKCRWMQEWGPTTMMLKTHNLPYTATYLGIRIFRPQDLLRSELRVLPIVLRLSLSASVHGAGADAAEDYIARVGAAQRATAAWKRTCIVYLALP
jgi:hypothetical protein